MIDSLPITVYSLRMSTLTSLSADEILLPRYTNWSTNFRGFHDGKIIKIPRREFIFRTCEDGVVLHLIPRRISPCSESFLGHIGTGILCGG